MNAPSSQTFAIPAAILQAIEAVADSFNPETTLLIQWEAQAIALHPVEGAILNPRTHQFYEASGDTKWVLGERLLTVAPAITRYAGNATREFSHYRLYALYTLIPLTEVQEASRVKVTPQTVIKC